MIEPRNSDLCEQALDYMYDMAEPDTKNRVPEEIRDHIDNCEFCSKELSSLRKYLADHVIFAQSRATSMAQAAAHAEAHFAFAGKLVDCRTVKGFLPLLANPRLAVTIPTPITVHQADCEQCTAGYSTLCSLSITSRQLNTLAVIYSGTGSGDLVECADVRNWLEVIGDMYFDRVPVEILTHICLCRPCREQLYNIRQATIKKLSTSQPPHPQLCEKIDDYFLFDCCVPATRHLETDDRIFGHLRQCPNCLGKMQQMHRAIYNIADRPNSDVITCYELAPIVWDRDNPNAAVGCSVVKGFLPQFARDELELIIPSALTSHLEKCDQCWKDFETIADLQLNPFQLSDLQSIFTGKPERTKVSCSQARRYIESFVALDFNKINWQVSKHLCICPDCRDLVYKHRGNLIKQLTSTGQSKENQFSCENLKPIDYFDYCFPCGADITGPRAQNPPEFHKAFIAHAPKCPDCLFKMQQLHKTISAIAKRPDSGVFTANNLPLPANRKEGFFNLDYCYSNYPIRVWIRNKAEAELRKAAKIEHDDYLKNKSKASVPVIKFPLLGDEATEKRFKRNL